MNTVVDSRRNVKGSKLSTVAKTLGLLFVLGLCAAILFPIFATPTHGYRPSCLTHMKQTLLGAIMYQSDADDKLPPYFTFDGSEATKKYMTATMPYLKNEQIFLCPQDKGYPTKSEASPYEKMSYVHPLALKGNIPNFGKGNRTVIATEIIQSLETTTYLRDPVRFDPKEDNKQLRSPHGEKFNVGYLDGHAKAREHLSVNTDL
jgi:prepilin-type processing-associated H-X9-DG protein